MTANKIQQQLDALATPEKKAFLPYFFKTGKGQYGEGDKFLGVVVPDVRKVAKEYKALSFSELEQLLKSEYHECRLCALLILIEQFKKSKDTDREKIYEFYLANSRYVNNWDLVDLSCYHIVGEHLLDKDRSRLYELADSPLLWDQRIAVVSTMAFIRKNDFKDILSLSERLLDHKHDLMHKACGWMLREAGKRDEEILKSFLDKHHKVMPRTMLRYSIEKLTKEERAHYMKK